MPVMDDTNRELAAALQAIGLFARGASKSRSTSTSIGWGCSTGRSTREGWQGLAAPLAAREEERWITFLQNGGHESTSHHR